MRSRFARCLVAFFVVLAGAALGLSAPVPAQSVDDFTLINADTDGAIRTVASDATIQLSNRSTTNLSIRANTSGGASSVVFDFAGESPYQTEDVEPYALNGDSSGDYDPASELAQPGTYTLTATPYPQDDAGGTAGTALTVTLTVEDDGSGGSDPSCASLAGSPVVAGEQKRWHPITITFEGPCTSEGSAPNPFLDYRLQVTFEHPSSGTTVTVPGFYAADGNAAETSATSGNRWRVHFLPRQTGDWSFTASFREGSGVATSLDPSAGTATSFDGANGSFTVAETDKTGRDHRGKGVLTYVGSRYLEFDNGERFLKGGADSPENLLAYSDFDGTYNNSGTDYVRGYTPHEQDWTSGDPSWQNGEGKGLIGALNYLASEAMNAFSFLTMNVNGDGDDVWPWTSPTNRLRYDVSKLAQWDIVFSHSDRLGLFKHFKTQETENDDLLDGGSLGPERKLYYRELIARFGYHHALNWNLGEENTNSDSERAAFVDYFTALDPYDHPIVVHTYPNQKDGVYGDLVGDADFNGPSLQLGGMSDSEANGDVTEWLRKSDEAGRPWNVSIDEPGNATSGLQPDSDDNYDSAREVMWAAFLGGADGLEWYFGYQYPDDDLNADDWRSRDRFWDYHRYALEYMRRLPLASMASANDRLGGESGYAFSDGSDVFVAYLKDGGTGATLDLPSGSFTVRWFDPRNGGALQASSDVSGGGGTSLGAPPNNTNQDWIVEVTRGGPLPVELTQFGAAADGPETALLTWTTASETDNAGFEVQHRAPDQDAFAAVNFVDGQGTTSTTTSYRYRVADLGPGRHAFRLRQVDTDGSTTLSETVELTLSMQDAFTLSAPSPHPVQAGPTAMTLRVRQAQTVEAALYNALGQQVRVLHEGPVPAQSDVTLRVDGSGLSSGVYFVRVAGERFSTTRRLVVVQ
jgi:hypothetical protein